MPLPSCRIESGISAEGRAESERSLYAFSTSRTCIPIPESSVRAFARARSPEGESRSLCLCSRAQYKQFEKPRLELETDDRGGRISAFEKEDRETGFRRLDAIKRAVKIVRLAFWIRGRDIRSNATHRDVIRRRKRFPNLLTTGAPCNTVKFLTGEFHHAPGNHNYYPINLERRERRWRTRCYTSWTLPGAGMSLEDDESYLKNPHDLRRPKRDVDGARVDIIPSDSFGSVIRREILETKITWTHGPPAQSSPETNEKISISFRAADVMMSRMQQQRMGEFFCKCNKISSFQFSPPAW
eukprot:CAMPEP_0172541534 /NCGR_PEP_ID=MMETSP1067-20121228/12330_1 /TAXON_ID=265564 ORGANISM="Thalassiosira punctigera, Strain Tpunct2005C2" /NCGR_SAMPLE_ID=MMETSP1067 /ASSEMBLY_ACC=CAM_ASM_000444 /LENGTH=297 /DNA_ID=CAMNT_0013327599 /DNA_START=18 /DNA_END=911 /DNA_ORIENTATION=+